VDRLRLLVETFYDYQKGRIAYFNRLNRFPEEVRQKLESETLFKQISDDLSELEKTIIKAIKKEISKDELYTKILSRIKGIGAVTGADLIAWVCRERDFTMGKTHPFLEKIKELPYAKIENVSKTQVRVRLPPVLDIAKYPSDFYKYCGLIPGSKKIKGRYVNYNPKLKTHFWKIVSQILKARKSYYVDMYNHEKSGFLKKYQREYEKALAKLKKKARNEKELKKLIKEAKLGSPKMKAHLTAIKKVSRHLALTLYLAYKYFKKQPAYLPYPIETLKHNIEMPFVDGIEGVEPLEFLIDYAKKFKR